MKIDELLSAALGQHTASQQPVLLEEISTLYVEEGIVIQNHLAQNRFGDSFVITSATPKKRRFSSPVIAAHQTNDYGKHEVFGIRGSEELNYGLMLARRGHRVFGIDLRWTGERSSENYWDFANFCNKYPAWSPMGADCNDFQDLIYLLKKNFNESSPMNWIGHSHGGINGYVLAAIEKEGTFSHMVCNAAYIGLNNDFDIAQLPNLEPYFKKSYSSELWRSLDKVLELACTKATIKLNCYLSDTILKYPTPTLEQQHYLAKLKEKLIISVYEEKHSFPLPLQIDSALFLEQTENILPNQLVTEF